MGDDEARQPGIAKGEPAPSDAAVKERMASPPPVKVVAPVLCAGDAGSKCARGEGACGLGGASWFDGVCAREVGAGRQGYWQPDLCDKGQEGKGEVPHTIARQGTAEQSAAGVAQDLGGVGHDGVVRTRGQEPGRVAPKAVAKMTHDTDVSSGEPPAGESESNGEAERGVRAMKAPMVAIRRQWARRPQGTMESSTRFGSASPSWPCF